MKNISSTIKEKIRKLIVRLKRNPSIISIVIYAVTFLIYSLNFTSITEITININRKWMGLSIFAVMLFSILGFVLLLNIYPDRKPTNKIFLVLFSIIIFIVLFCDVVYFVQLSIGLSKRTDLNSGTKKSLELLNYANTAKSTVITNFIMLLISLVSTYLNPVYKVLLNKIDTTKKIETNENLDSINLSDINQL